FFPVYRPSRSPFLLSFFFIYCSLPLRVLHSFPTRRSSDLVVTYRHAIRNAILPVVSFLGPLVASILTGSFIVEKIFAIPGKIDRSEEHTSELQSRFDLVCRLLLEKKKKTKTIIASKY